MPGPPPAGPAGTGPVDPRGGTLETSTLLRRLPGVERWELELVARELLTPSMVRLWLSGQGLATLRHRPGQDLMFAVPAGVGGHFRRRYTIRRLDRAAGAVAVDVFLHGDAEGPGAAWASAASTGDRVEALGPRGKVVVDEVAEWHLFAGDDAALPAVFTMVESLPAGATALVILEVGGHDDEQDLSLPGGAGQRLDWLHRHDRRPGEGAALAEAVAALPLPPGRGHAYLAGELAAVASMRTALAERGLQPPQISAKAYWRRGVANAAHGEPGGD